MTIIINIGKVFIELESDGAGEVAEIDKLTSGANREFNKIFCTQGKV